MQQKDRYLFIPIVALITFALNGCGGGGGTDATNDQAQAAVNAAGEAAIMGISDALESVEQSLVMDQGDLADSFKTAITVTGADKDSCTEGGFSECENSDNDHLVNTTINGEGEGGGSCTVDVCGLPSGESISFDAVLVCSGYKSSQMVGSTSYTVTLDGTIGIDGTSGASSGSYSIDTSNFTVGVTDGSDSLSRAFIVNLDVDYTISGSSATLEATGCSCLDNDCFSVSGSEEVSTSLSE